MPGEGPVSVWNPNCTSTSQHVQRSYVPLQPCMCPDLSSHLFPGSFPASLAIKTFIQRFAEALAWSCLSGAQPLPYSSYRLHTWADLWRPQAKPMSTSTVQTDTKHLENTKFHLKRPLNHKAHYLQKKTSSTPTCGLTMKRPSALAEVIIQWIVNHIPTTHNQIYFMS